MAELKGNKYGTHRVIEPKGVLTQAAWKVDNDYVQGATPTRSSAT